MTWLCCVKIGKVRGHHLRLLKNFFFAIAQHTTFLLYAVRGC